MFGVEETFEILGRGRRQSRLSFALSCCGCRTTVCRVLYGEYVRRRSQWPSCVDVETVTLTYPLLLPHVALVNRRILYFGIAFASAHHVWGARVVAKAGAVPDKTFDQLLPQRCHRPRSPHLIGSWQTIPRRSHAQRRGQDREMAGSANDDAHGLCDCVTEPLQPCALPAPACPLPLSRSSPFLLHPLPLPATLWIPD